MLKTENRIDVSIFLTNHWSTNSKMYGEEVPNMMHSHYRKHIFPVPFYFVSCGFHSD